MNYSSSDRYCSRCTHTERKYHYQFHLPCGGCGAEKEPVTITIWNYYNGEQLEAFNRMVQNFNDTVGKEQGITVESASQGSVNDLETNVLNAAEGKVGAEELPNIFSGYADTAYALD